MKWLCKIQFYNLLNLSIRDAKLKFDDLELRCHSDLIFLTLFDKLDCFFPNHVLNSMFTNLQLQY